MAEFDTEVQLYTMGETSGVVANIVYIVFWSQHLNRLEHLQFSKTNCEDSTHLSLRVIIVMIHFNCFLAFERMYALGLPGPRIENNTFWFYWWKPQKICNLFQHTGFNEKPSLTGLFQVFNWIQNLQEVCTQNRN